VRQLTELSNKSTDLHSETNDGILDWKEDKALTIIESDISMSICHGWSIHHRIKLTPITIHHLWIVL
jgi:hypothetical protein